MEPAIAETMYQIFRQTNGDLLDGLDDAQAGFTWTDRPEQKIDPRVHYPVDFTQAYAWMGETEDPPTESVLGKIPYLLHAFGNYRRTRTVYTIDRTLLRHLVDSRWPASIPIEAASLPKNGCVLDLPAHEVFGAENIQGNDRVQVICSYDMNPDTGGLDMVLSGLCLRRNSEGLRELVSLEGLTAWLNLSSPNLEDAILDYAIFMHDAFDQKRSDLLRAGNTPDEMNRASEEKLFSKEWFRYLKTILSVLLYINGNDDLLEIEQPADPGPMNKAKRRRLAKEGTLPKAERSLRQYQVGRKFASIIQRWEEQERSDAERTGRSVRPHLRAAHAHLYRVGKGRTGQRVKFLPPIPVKGWEAPETVPATRLVK
jgi:hypothetical protein